MKPILFPQSNVTPGANQPEYLPLPAYTHQADPQGILVTCWQLTLRERVKLLFTGKLWLTVMTFRQPLQPQLPSVTSPFAPTLPVTPQQQVTP